MWLWIVLGLIAVAVLLILIMWAVGRRLPEEHIASSTLRLAKTPPQTAWAVIEDVERYPEWSAVTKVERLPDRDGRVAWRQHMGRNSFVLERTRHDPPRALTLTVVDDAKFFPGRWEYSIAPAGAGSTVTLTEHGRIHHAIPRFMMAYLMDPGMYLKKQLRSLAARLGEEPNLQ